MISFVVVVVVVRSFSMFRLSSFIMWLPFALLVYCFLFLRFCFMLIVRCVFYVIRFPFACVSVFFFGLCSPAVNHTSDQ